MKLFRNGPMLKPDPARVLLLPFGPFVEPHFTRILARVMAISEAQVALQLEQVLAEFGGRHHHLERFCRARFDQLRPRLFSDEPVSEARRTLVGAFFTKEHSVESAALFNPSMIWHPDQSGLPEGARRFILSLRSVGEGHLSCISFRSGVIDGSCRITLDPVSPYVTAPVILDDPYYDKPLFMRKLGEIGHADGFADEVLAALGDRFTMTGLRESVASVQSARGWRRTADPQHGRHPLIALAEANYAAVFDSRTPLSERIIFPHSPSEANGIEDARWVELKEEDGSSQYVATYTAYDGRLVLPQLVTTPDFLSFNIATLNGSQVQDKGMGLFPRRIDGRYAMLSRQDGENIYLMTSDALQFWDAREIAVKPRYPWEFVQVGNCGSPIETPEGWLVITHGVGPMRKYSLGAFLLDLDNPARVIGRLREPLMGADAAEREGYVPNVLYSCGGQIHGGHLVLPYAMSDWACGFVLVELRALLDELKAG